VIFNPLFEDEIFLSSLNGGAERLKFYRYGLSDLTLPYPFWNSYQGCQQEGPRNFCRGCYVFDNGGLYNRLPSNVDKAVWLLFPEILVLVLLLMLVGYCNGSRVHVALALRLKLKLQENLHSYSQVYGLTSMLFFC
jgi:hypothetical protein